MKETIKFSDFMDGSYKIRKPKTYYSFSFIPLIPKLMFFNEPVLLLSCIGITLIGIALFQMNLVKKGNEILAETISMVMSFILPVAGFSAFFYVLYRAFRTFL